MAAQQLVILGGTGFVGSHLVPRLVADGHRIVLLSRNRERHREFGVLPTVSVRSADIYDDDVLRRQLAGADAVINLVGILNPRGRDSFQRVHVELTRRLLAACEAGGVRRLHQMSSLKAGQGLSQYLKSRGEAEALVRASALDWTIYQPSVIFGRGDGLVSRFAKLLRQLPALPLARAPSRMAPTFVDDVAEAIARCVGDAKLGVRRSFELYGPEVLTLGEIVRAIRAAAGLRTPIIALPDSLGRLQAQFAGLLPGKPFSLDNFRSLLTDSVGTVDGYAALGIVPQALTRWLPSLLGGPPRHRRLAAARSLRR
ncbi:epimerase [Rhodanobacter thiooxydans]|uniref:Epimerase n=1 Tax=Rhodanobacter thiooxydans TaxID=416169 RepID=A0A154QGD9_9GAMM|nr:complex I NDUFA9 subunit family protein [Rhodanobacter thiooxydans]EIM03289.1 putative nucleoside-diphosphate sugar epimerase [Rhodanobacter thiooxydans LCS2]KZC23343.1 epimerase [Rhodanobacter thiooxydans]MCW0201223.1 complex I NDUFA9 subunit family protein [Rhodanobacter thiooxydans]